MPIQDHLSTCQFRLTKRPEIDLSFFNLGCKFTWTHGVQVINSLLGPSCYSLDTWCASDVRQDRRKLFFTRKQRLFAFVSSAGRWEVPKSPVKLRSDAISCCTGLFLSVHIQTPISEVSSRTKWTAVS